MEHVFVLQHVNSRADGVEDVKFIGVYSTSANANHAVAQLRRQPGFCDSTDGFHVDKYRIDEDHWTEGYVTLEGS